MYQSLTTKTAGYEQTTCWFLLYRNIEQGVESMSKCKKSEQRTCMPHGEISRIRKQENVCKEYKNHSRVA